MYYACDTCLAVFNFVSAPGSTIKWPRTCPECDSSDVRPATKQEAKLAAEKEEAAAAKG